HGSSSSEGSDPSTADGKELAPGPSRDARSAPSIPWSRNAMSRAIVFMVVTLLKPEESCPRSFYQPLLPQLLADGGPLVLAVHEVIPIGLRLPPGNQFPERGDVQDHAVVEVGVKVEVRRPAELLLEVPEFGEERILAVDVLVELLEALA